MVHGGMLGWYVGGVGARNDTLQDGRAPGREVDSRQVARTRRKENGFPDIDFIEKAGKKKVGGGKVWWEPCPAWPCYDGWSGLL